MMMRHICIVLLFLVSACMAESVPTFDELRPRFRQEHPRMFITGEEWGMLKSRAALPLLHQYVTEFQEYLAKLPSPPRLEVRPDMAKMEDGKIVFIKQMSNQNAVSGGVRYAGGSEAAICALLYRITDDPKYLELAIQYMRVANEFCALSQRSRILPEWYHFSRLGMFVAYDWLHDKLTQEQRRELVGPLLRHVQWMRKPGFHNNGGDGTTTGNYGERGLRWYAGLAAYNDGVEDELAEAFLKEGYNNFCKMMEHREEISCGTGLLTSICSEYSFFRYPWASYNFMHTLRTATGLDVTKIWTQPRDYANYFNWMCIPLPNQDDGYLEYGWGDTNHIVSKMHTAFMYTHCAQAIHFYGENPQMRAIMALLPLRQQHIVERKVFPWTAFILTGFNPEYKLPDKPWQYLDKSIATYYPSYGLMNVRSGFTANDTFASIKAGASETGHQHYDELSFVIYKKGFQALDTGNRGNMAHHKAYYPQTVAHNSLLIRMPDEPFPKHWYPQNGPKVDWSGFRNDGGQCEKKARPLGFACNSFYAATAADATTCYAETKCKEVSRIFVYVKPDYFVVYDRVESTKPEYQKVFLLHTQGEPEQRDGFWRSQGGEGALFLRTLLPAAVRTEIIGGPGREFWTNGRNFPVDAPQLLPSIKQCGGLEKTWLGRYRYEISSETPRLRDHFLTLLQAADAEEKEMVASTLLQGDETDGIRFTTCEGLTAELHFRKNGPLNGTLLLTQDEKLLFHGVLLK